MALTAGTRLGHYEIVSAIGAGGMGEVYCARDTRLHRDVAIKVLPDRLTSDPEVEIFLEQPGPPVHDEATAAQLRELITKGATGSLVLHTNDARGLYETLKERGVTDFTQEPMDHFYGTDMGIRDPFGNGIRILQPKKARQEATA